MSATDKVIVESQDCPIATTAVYTAPASTRAKIDRFTATNTSASAITLDVHLVPPGGVADATNLIVKLKSIAAGSDESITTPAGHTLAAGGAIHVLASATGLSIRVTGREYT